MEGIYNTPEVSNARETARRSSETAAQSAQSAMTLPDMLRDSLTKKFEGNPLYGQRETALENYFQTATQAPLDFTHTSAGGRSDVVYTPMEQANLIQGARTNTLLPITTINSLLGLQAGGLDNIIDSASRAAQAQVMGLQSQAQLDRQAYTDLIDLISKQADEDFRYAELNKPSGSSSSDNNLLELIRLLTGGQTTSLPGSDLWELVETPTQAPQVPQADLRGLNLSLNSGGGMGELRNPPQSQKKKNEPLPTFQSFNQLFGY